MIKLNAKCVLLAAEFMAVQDVRFYLMGIKVEPHPDGGAMLIATNGHMMIVVHDREAEHDDEEVIVAPSKLALSMLRKASKNGKRLVVTSDPVRRQLLVQDAITQEVQFIQPEQALIESKFPDWRRIIPAADTLQSGLFGSFQTRYIRHICDALAKFSSNKYGAFVRWYGTPGDSTQEENKGAVFSVSGASLVPAFGMLMPGSGGITQPIPDWFPVETKAEQQDAA